MVKEKNKLVLVALAFLFISGCSFLSKPPSFESTHTEACKVTYSNLITSGEPVRHNKAMFNPVFFGYKTFNRGFRDELACIVGKVKPLKNLAVVFYSIELDSAIILFEDVDSNVLMVTSFFSLKTGQKSAKMEVFIPLLDSLVALSGNNPSGMVFQLGSYSGSMNQEDFSVMIKALSDDKFPETLKE